MTLRKTVEIEIDIDQIIEEYDLGFELNSNWNTIMLSVNDYVAGFDDCEYYLISFEDREEIARTIAEKLNVPEGEYEE